MFRKSIAQKGMGVLNYAPTLPQNKFRKLLPSPLFRILACLVIGAGLASTAFADPYSLGSAGQFAVLGFGNGFTNQFQPGPLTVNGNVGVGAGGDMILQGAGQTISGHVYYADPITASNFSATGTNNINGMPCSSFATCTGNGSVTQNTSLVTSASTAVAAMYNSAKALNAPTTGAPTGNLSSNFTWNGNGGTNVASLTSLNLSSGDTLTLTGTASDFFVFNISGGWNMSGSGHIVLNGVSSDHVLFNLLKSADGGNGAAIGASGSALGYGILLALDRNITFDTPGGAWNGRLFSDTDSTIHLFSEATINQPTPPGEAPEPASMVLLGLGLMGTAGVIRRRRNAKSA